MLLSPLHVAAVARSPSLLKELIGAAELGGSEASRVFDSATGRPAIELAGGEPELSMAYIQSLLEALPPDVALRSEVHAPSLAKLAAFTATLTREGQAAYVKNVGAASLTPVPRGVHVTVLKGAVPDAETLEQEIRSCVEAELGA